MFCRFTEPFVGNFLCFYFFSLHISKVKDFNYVIKFIERNLFFGLNVSHDIFMLIQLLFENSVFAAFTQ